MNRILMGVVGGMFSLILATGGCVLSWQQSRLVKLEADAVTHSIADAEFREQLRNILNTVQRIERKVDSDGRP